MLRWLVRQRNFCLMHQSRRRLGLLFTAEEQTMSAGRIAILLAGLMLGGCRQATRDRGAETNLKPGDKQFLAGAPYPHATTPDPYRRHSSSYHRREAPGTVVI